MTRKSSARSGRADYDVHPSVAYAQAIIVNLPAKTGKSLQEWIRLLEKSGPSGHRERWRWLMKEHQVGNTTAWMIAEQAEGQGTEDTDAAAYLKAAAEYVEQMYAGPKAALRPIHARLLELGRALGPDIRVCPCKTIVPIYRRHVIAQIKPATRTRIDFGLALRGATQRLPRRLLETGGLAKVDRITHRFPLASVEEVDDEVITWLQVAYDLDARE
jgi:Domain of unknown function (DUF5655)/Domain of unknown function (DUF4287)